MLQCNNKSDEDIQASDDHGYILRNPVTGVKIPKTGTKESRALTVEEQHRLLDAARNNPRPIMFAVVFALYTGCRKGEIFGLQWSDIDLDEGKVHISKQFNRHFDIDHEDGKRSALGLSTPKTKGSVRDIYICDSFCKELKAYKEKMVEWKKQNKFVHSEEDFVFVGIKNTRLSREYFTNTIPKFCQKPKSTMQIFTLSVTPSQQDVSNRVWIFWQLQGCSATPM